MCKRILILTSLLVLSLTLPAWSQADVSDALRLDAQEYSERYGVDLDEAIDRLLLQIKIGDLNALLMERESDTFAGLWIEHEPEYRVVIRSTDAYFGERLPGMLQEKSLAGLIDIEPARWSFQELERLQVISRHLADQTSVPVDTDINVFENRVEVYAVQDEMLKNDLALKDSALPEGVSLIPVEQLARTQQALILGGADISGCTGGFTVRRTGDDELGLLTAGHCPNVQTFNGVSLPFRNEDQEGNQDVQWNSIPCALLNTDNRFDSGIGLRPCTGEEHRNDQAIGTFVCKFGQVTGRTCGDILSNNYAPSYVTSAASTFMRVDGDAGNDLSSPGDSGGPWYVGNTAFGTHSGEPGPDLNDALYMAINFINTIGVELLTAPAPCPSPPTASFTYRKFFGTRVDFDASSSNDPDGTIVSYRWNFGDGTVVTSSWPTFSYWYLQTGTYGVSLTVTDNDGNTDYTTDSVNLCPNGQYFC